MNKQPLLILVICFIPGIFFQDQLVLDENFIYLIIGLCGLLLIPMFLGSFFFYKVKPYLLAIMFFGIGIVLHFFNTSSTQNISVDKNETLIFKITKKLNSNEKNKKYEAIVQSGKGNFNAVIYCSKKERELDFDHYYQSMAYVSKPKSPKYDFQFNYAKYLQRKNIEYQCYINDEVFSVERNDLRWREKFSQKRLDIIQNINQTSMSSQTNAFLKGIILADRTEIDMQTIRDFSRSGLVHFLAISGTHIVAIFGLLYFLLTTLLSVKFRKYAVTTSLIFIWIFTVFIGFGSSAVRATIMLSVYFTYVLLQRKTDVLHALALSAFIILIFDTQQLFDIGFQLSFLAVLGIFWLNQPILNYLPKQNNRFKKIIFNTVSISVSAQLATLPLVLYYFHQFSFISIIANFFIVPFSEIIIVFSFLMTALVACNLDFQFLNSLYDFIIQILLRLIHCFADIEFLFFKNISMNLVEVFALFLVICLMRFTILKLNPKNSARLIMSIFLFFLIRIGFNLYECHKTEILTHYFNKNDLFSVKKGDAACFWINENADQEKIIQFIIDPYTASRRLRKVEIRILPSGTEKVVYKNQIYQIK